MQQEYDDIIEFLEDHADEEETEEESVQEESSDYIEYEKKFGKDNGIAFLFITTKLSTVKFYAQV